ELAGLPAAPDGERVRIEDHSWHGCLANIPAAEFSGRYEFRLPEEISGEEFLAGYAGITDTVTRVEPGRRYPVRAATAHPVREQARMTQFAQLLAALSERPDAAAALGGLTHGSRRPGEPAPPHPRAPPGRIARPAAGTDPPRAPR